ncbi:MAG: AraC family transcriptional regulator [Candidatus Cohnella colombiensis]|uniref:AraC family transcriptional regulator n=1 Tax=Candidatus Cohnella colombiensis TaxID=3121368 RepID=A0AA95JGN3_9BACL|nr:MAG: AraC family transcriptional regulator [Cohnella sp.]
MRGQGSLFDQRLLEGRYLPRVFAYYYKQWNDFHMAYHQHDSTEIMYVIQGECVVEMNEGKGKEHSFKLKKGELILLDANVPHRLIVEETCRMLNVEFSFEQYDGCFPSLKELANEEDALKALLASSVSNLILRDPDEVYHALKSLVIELDKRGSDGGALDRMLLAQLLIRIGRLWRDTENESKQPSEHYVKLCMEYMQQNYDRNIQVKDIAAAVNVHPGYLHRIFKQHAGTTLTEYLTSLRMEKAKMLLLHSNIAIADIADYVGIGSRQYFHALFKKHTELTPIAFRSSINTQLLDARGK